MERSTEVGRLKNWMVSGLVMLRVVSGRGSGSSGIFSAVQMIWVGWEESGERLNSSPLAFGTPSAVH